MNRLQQIEREVLTAGREWTRALLEKRLQEECLTVEMVSPETGEELENTRWRLMGLDTVVGKVNLKVHHGHCPEKGWVCPTRQAWGLKPYERKTPELQARLAYTATVAGSYAEAEKLATIWGTPVSDTSIHQCVQELGEQAQELTPRGQMRGASAGGCPQQPLTKRFPCSRLDLWRHWDTVVERNHQQLRDAPAFRAFNQFGLEPRSRLTNTPPHKSRANRSL